MRSAEWPKCILLNHCSSFKEDTFYGVSHSCVAHDAVHGHTSAKNQSISDQTWESTVTLVNKLCVFLIKEYVFHIPTSLSCCCLLVDILGSTGGTKQSNHTYLLILFVKLLMKSPPSRFCFLSNKQIDKYINRLLNENVFMYKQGFSKSLPQADAHYRKGCWCRLTSETLVI